ncbi:hypothetical protein HDK77DRAFT_441217 [Phyllosticta capitalensis]|uniref:uncharacterized protein n=1 Tax=Phyllosticta capitalensis TaxID=121624 RepID=UPI003131DBEC
MLCKGFTSVKAALDIRNQRDLKRITVHLPFLAAPHTKKKKSAEVPCARNTTGPWARGGADKLRYQQKSADGGDRRKKKSKADGRSREGLARAKTGARGHRDLEWFAGRDRGGNMTCRGGCLSTTFDRGEVWRVATGEELEGSRSKWWGEWKLVWSHVGEERTNGKGPVAWADGTAPEVCAGQRLAARLDFQDAGGVCVPES